MAKGLVEAQVSLIINQNPKSNHVNELLSLIQTSDSFDCISAFASSSGLELIYDALVNRLKKGLATRFLLGVDFWQTDPTVFYDLMELQEDYDDLEVFMGNPNSARVFHPKVYAFRDSNLDSKVYVGSANLTGGGLLGNHEWSLFAYGNDSNLYETISTEIENLIRSRDVVEVEESLVDAYAAEYAEHSFQQKLARKRARLELANAATRGSKIQLAKLQDILDIMQRSPSATNPAVSEFDEQKRIRNQTRHQARAQLDLIANAGNLSKNDFLRLYEPLVVSHLWHSGNLHRQRAKVAANAAAFQDAVRLVNTFVNAKTVASTTRFFDAMLDQFKKIPHAGINIMTELLHSFDNKRFPIMNRNSVSGLMLANITGFPPSLTKKSITPEKYQNFCNEAEKIRNGLGLADFTELDALLNYAYWN